MIKVRITCRQVIYLSSTVDMDPDNYEKLKAAAELDNDIDEHLSPEAYAILDGAVSIHDAYDNDEEFLSVEVTKHN